MNTPREARALDQGVGVACGVEREWGGRGRRYKRWRTPTLKTTRHEVIERVDEQGVRELSAKALTDGGVVGAGEREGVNVTQGLTDEREVSLKLRPAQAPSLYVRADRLSDHAQHLKGYPKRCLMRRRPPRGERALIKP
jgi:hypothetical protein